MFWGKKKDAKPKEAAKAATKNSSSPPGIKLAIDQAFEVEAGHLGCVAGVAGPGGYVIAQGQGIRSVASLPVKPGETLLLETAIYADTDPTNGEPLVFFTGALMYDVSGQIVHWWTPNPPISRLDGVRTMSAKIVAPPEVVSARIGICGPWKPQGEVSNGKIGVKVAALKKL